MAANGSLQEQHAGMVGIVHLMDAIPQTRASKADVNQPLVAFALAHAIWPSSRLSRMDRQCSKP